MPPYQYAPEQCDVANRGRLLEYREKRAEWLRLLNDDPEHSIRRQIASMLWSFVVFDTVNTVRGLAHDAGRPSAAHNGPLARFIDQGFVATQALSIRKLMEKPDHREHRQVISLRRVLDEVREHRQLITREMYVAHDGLPYDPEPARQRHIDSVVERGGVSVDWMPTTGPEAFDMSELVHEQFDRLTGIPPAARNRDDLIRPDVFERLDQRLAESDWEAVVLVGNKFVAHAADVRSRTVLDGRRGFSLNDLARCHEAIARVSDAINGKILYHGTTGGLPTPQFDQFQHLDEQWALSADMDRLNEAWKAHDRRIAEWRNSDWVLEGLD